ncbi:hypothetical protein [Microbispora sp. NPDC049125]|uniref:hypothetical protein n=1 Tax=Microbispora sp. NPDC049125 TaxID=3154929 RepID=UPI003466DA16
MILPGFTADASCYRSKHSYAGFSGAGSGAGPALLRPAQELMFTCDSQSCACAGLPDCIDMFGTNVCGPGAQCDSTGGDLTCQCFRP